MSTNTLNECATSKQILIKLITCTQHAGLDVSNIVFSLRYIYIYGKVYDATLR